MTNLVAIATEFVPQDFPVRMALTTQRRYRRNWIFTILTAVCTGCRCSAGRGVLFPCVDCAYKISDISIHPADGDLAGAERRPPCRLGSGRSGRPPRRCRWRGQGASLRRAGSARPPQRRAGLRHIPPATAAAPRAAAHPARANGGPWPRRGHWGRRAVPERPPAVETATSPRRLRQGSRGPCCSSRRCRPRHIPVNAAVGLCRQLRQDAADFSLADDRDRCPSI